jgi:hypothetical protein
MKTTAPSRTMEFCIQRPYNLILVEEREDGITVRAAADDFNEQRKGAFIRELAAEGFIPDRYQWYCGSDSSGYSGVTWIIDRSWLASTPALMRRKAAPWIAGMFAGACVMFLLLMSIIVARHG